MSKAAAILDVDGTLVPGSVGVSFTKYLFGDEYPFAGGIEEAINRYWMDPDYSYEELAADIVDHWATGLEIHEMRCEAVRHKAEEFIADEYEIPSSAYTLVSELATRSFDLYLVSLSPQEVLEPFSAELTDHEFVEVYGTVVSVDSTGTYTDEFHRDMSTGKGKQAVIDEIFDRSAREHSIAFGDTVFDVPILDAVEKPVLVSSQDANENDDCDPLVEAAHENEWNYWWYRDIDAFVDDLTGIISVL